jgi:hypothetical protein
VSGLNAFKLLLFRLYWDSSSILASLLFGNGGPNQVLTTLGKERKWRRKKVEEQNKYS